MNEKLYVSLCGKLHGDREIEFSDKDKIINDIYNQVNMLDKRTRK